jgi:DNA-binding CsgD family transcriptional regulator
VVQVHPLLDAARLLHDLQQINEIAESLSGQFNPSAIARQVTDALVERFGCAFARIWLVEPNQRELRLVASSGLYTHINGSFARVPMGAFKVGKIAQNRVPFLSNQLADEPWVKDRQWALDNQIRGFAGYPLVAGDRVVGVLACFSHEPYAPEFLEVLQVLCMTLTVALEAALQVTSGSVPRLSGCLGSHSLSDQLAQILGSTKLTLVGTERPLRPVVSQTFLQSAEILQSLDCSYCRLTYTDRHVMLEAIAVARPRPQDSVTPELESVPLEGVSPCDGLAVVRSHFTDLKHLVSCLGGTLQAQPVMAGQACQISLILPSELQQIAVQVQCRHPLLHHGMTQLVHQAGLVACDADSPAAVCITDTPARLGSLPVLWVRHDQSPVPDQAAAILDLTTTPERLRHLVDQAMQGKATVPEPNGSLLSEREQQIMRLLAEGKRDRNIAAELYISESTVKFHINNSLTKLKARNRYQGVYQAAIQGWI